MAEIIPPNRGPSESRSPMDWVQEHARYIAIGTVVVAALGSFYLLYQRMSASTSQQAEQAYFQAQGGGQTNPEEREQALDRVITRYDGTAAAVQAAMVLAQSRYDRGAYAEGVAALRRVEGTKGASEFAPSVNSLIAAGLEGQGDFAAAAAKYREAAEASRFDADRDTYLADAARALRRAGNEAEAVRIWTQLAEDPSGAVAAEARVRLGELTAKPAGQG